MKNITPIFLAFLLTCCASIEPPPKNTKNICAIFAEKTDWAEYTQLAFEKWELPVHVQMAIMQQESDFVANARPRSQSTSAYGYAQALDGSWREYLNSRQATDAQRDNFADACDFTGWYCHLSYETLGISKLDTYNLYLAYHEGKNGYKRKSHLYKPWLLAVAKKVARNAQLYRQQLEECRN